MAEDTATASPTLHGLLGALADREPGRVALKSIDASLTFGELWRRAGSVGSLLVEHGLSPGDVVAVAMPRSIDMVVGSLGVFRAGGVVLALDLRVPPARNRKLSGIAQARWALVQGDEVPEAVAGLSALRMDRAPLDVAAPGLQSRSHEDACLIFTSGSSGEPKAVLLSHAALAARARTEPLAYGLASNDIYLFRTSPAFVGFAVALAFLAGGVTLAVAGDEVGDRAEPLAALIRDLQATFLPFSPRLIDSLLATPGLSDSLSHVRVLRSAGEALPVEIANRLRAALPRCRLVDGYGTTETSGVILSAEVAGPFASGDGAGGRPLPGVRVRIMGSLGEAADEGEIQISTPMLASRYLGGESTEDRRFIEEKGDEGIPVRWYRTGDLGRLAPDGRILVLGRMDIQLNINGVRAEPREIEDALRLHPSVADAAVWMQTDASGRPRLVAYIVDRGTPALTPALRSFLADLLPAPLIPARFARLPTLPLTTSGKVNRPALPRPEEMDRTPTPPRDQRERVMLDLFSEALETEGLGVTDDFFEWGGDSLKAVALMTRVFEATGIRLPAAALLNAPTAESLAREVALGNRGQVMAVWVRRSGDLEPLVCLPGLAADPLWMVPLVAVLDPRQPLLGLSFVGLLKPITIPGAAMQGIAELQRVQPRGPYFLLGHSLGGVLAFEMARELARRGERISFLGLLDTNVPGALRRPRRSSTVVGWKTRLKGWGTTVSARARSRLRGILAAVGVMSARPAPPLPQPGFRAALQGHRVEPSDLSVTFFRAEGRPGGVDPAEAWAALARGGVEVIDIPGHHFNMIGGTNATALGSLIAKAVVRARAAS